jgi:hypothetical protein
VPIYLEFLLCGRVRAINAANNEVIATAEYTRLMSLIYPLKVRVI